MDDLDNLHLEVDPDTIADPAARAHLIFQHWHTDEVNTVAEVNDYATRLAAALEEAGLKIVLA